ncbi:hypothetical protein [Mycolicibacterium arenosum]|uniref:Alanine and proline rich membrane protein n=1 Tax=Mycolicibacterium arenosum TaxID=2952157 RepID=A0ABT1MDD1_9MYCO|nr:hypothetical protein [Mycolicibacterium sp. CAU 1645]MCP9276570.1 hypothetical protein [Mycolicibacterium sp. CAU 1645]
MSKAALTLGALGTTIGIAGLVVGLTALLRPEPSAPSPTATPTSATSPSPEEYRAAATEACAGFSNFKSGVGIARGAFIDRVDRANDWESPQSLGTQGYYFSAVGAELDYLDSRVSPEAPKELASAIASLRPSLTAVVDADLRREPASVSNKIVDEYSQTLDEVENACKAAGVS